MPRRRPTNAARSTRTLVLPLAAVLSVLSAVSPAAAVPTRALLDHNEGWFRTQLTGGAHNALDPSRPIEDQVTATTCLPTDQFVRVSPSGKTFELNGKPFIFAGWNQWEVLEAASDAPAPFRHLPLPGREHIVRQMNEAVSVGLKVMRMWAHTITAGHAMQPEPGVFDESILQGLDFVLHEASKRGLKIILALADNWYPVGGVDSYVAFSETATKHTDFFTDTRAIELFLDTHKVLSNRVNTFSGVQYKNDPTIMAWNLANEARCQNCDSQVMQTWIERTCAAFKQNAPNHLVGIGTEGFYGPESGQLSANPGLGGSTWASREGQDFLRNANTPCVDFVGVHVWPDDWNFAGVDFQKKFIKERIASVANMLPSGPKPFILEEFGKTVYPDETDEVILNANGGRTTPTRVEYFKAGYEVSEAAANSQELSGTLFWHWYDRGVGPGKYGVQSHDDVFSVIVKHADAMNEIGGVPNECAI